MEAVKILIVDDEEDIREILQFNLSNEGFLIDTASSGEEALEKLSPSHGLILLDVMMEGMSGYHVAEKLRKENNPIPIIFLTAKGAENDLLTGFAVGGDDYISKPFSIKEIIVRIKAVLRRNLNQIPALRDEPKEIVIGDMKLDMEGKHLLLKDRSIILTKKEFEILSLLMQHPKQIFTRDTILQTIWTDESFVMERTVDVHIARLRKKLDKYGACINNRSGYGYSFNDSICIC
ncbi:MAG: response regulator transcription factor [Dysgonamonadaceae bacterium]|jgi:DNA-binding response OmpR family regulator|nr:response regulator transcription factor [Dysgonamonadaceae bacterium]